MSIVNIYLSFLIYVLIFVEIFINWPMRGVYRLPGKWSKDSTLVVGGLAAFALAIFLASRIALPWYISVVLLILYAIYMNRLMQGIEKQRQARMDRLKGTFRNIEKKTEF